MAAVDLLRAAIVDALTDSPRLIIDLRRTSFLDSTCLGTIIAGRNRARKAGGWVRLVGARKEIRTILELTGLADILGIYDDIPSAAMVSASALP